MNIQDIADRLELEVEDIKELLGLLFMMSKGEVEKIFSALGKKDFPTVALSAHSLKGAVGNLGLMDLWERAQAMEMAARQADGDQTEKLARRLREELGALETELTD